MHRPCRSGSHPARPRAEEAAWRRLDPLARPRYRNLSAASLRSQACAPEGRQSSPYPHARGDSRTREALLSRRDRLRTDPPLALSCARGAGTAGSETDSPPDSSDASCAPREGTEPGGGDAVCGGLASAEPSQNGPRGRETTAHRLTVTDGGSIRAVRSASVC